MLESRSNEMKEYRRAESRSNDMKEYRRAELCNDKYRRAGVMI
jgi:hypothetical protein